MKFSYRKYEYRGLPLSYLRSIDQLHQLLFGFNMTHMPTE